MKVLGHVLFHLSFLRNCHTKSDHCFMTMDCLSVSKFEFIMLSVADIIS